MRVLIPVAQNPLRFTPRVRREWEKVLPIVSYHKKQIVFATRKFYLSRQLNENVICFAEVLQRAAHKNYVP